MSTLTDRYVHAVTTLLPEEQRPEIDRELRATIADMVEDRVDGGGPGIDAVEAERAALQELGHPSLLADGYRGGGRSLIGPRVYPVWLAMLKLLLSIVPAVAGVVAMAVSAYEGASTAAVVADGVVSALGAAFQVFLWVTLAFAVVERSDVDTEVFAPLVPSKEWTPDQLPEVQAESYGWGEAAFGIVTSMVGIVLLAGAGRLVRDDGDTVRILSDAALTWRWVVVAGLALGVLVACYVLVRRRWTVPAAAANLVSGVLVGVPLVWLLVTRNLFHPDALAMVPAGALERWGDTNHVVVAVIIVAILLWDAVDPFLKLRRGRA